MTTEKNYILDQAIAEKKLHRMALEIAENNMDEKSIILAGIRESGSVVAKCIQQILFLRKKAEIDCVIFIKYGSVPNLKS